MDKYRARTHRRMRTVSKKRSLFDVTASFSHITEKMFDSSCVFSCVLDAHIIYYIIHKLKVGKTLVYLHSSTIENSRTITFSSRTLVNTDESFMMGFYDCVGVTRVNAYHFKVLSRNLT